MTRGKKPVGAIRDAKELAERMGFRWQENTENPDLGYDLILFGTESLRLVKVRVLRDPVGPDTPYEELLPADIAGIRILPYPSRVPREIWLRTRHGRTFRRLLVLEGSVTLIGSRDPEGYGNEPALVTGVATDSYMGSEP